VVSGDAVAFGRRPGVRGGEQLGELLLAAVVALPDGHVPDLAGGVDQVRRGQMVS